MNNPYTQENIWTLQDGRRIALLTPKEIENLAPGTVLTSINGTQKSIEDQPDRDTRYGFTAWGFPIE